MTLTCETWMNRLCLFHEMVFIKILESVLETRTENVHIAQVDGHPCNMLNANEN